MSPLQAPGYGEDLKGDFYISDKMPGDKLFQEGMLTFFSEVEMIRSTLNNVLKPNGSQAAPARSCYDLFLCNPDLAEGHIVIQVFLAVGRIYLGNDIFCIMV